MKVVCKVLKYLLLIILLVIVLFNFKVNNNDLVSLFGYSSLKVVSGSMQPKIKVGDVVIIKNSNNYNINDIITFKDEGSYITHRIIKIDNGKITTKGDFNNKKDDKIIKMKDVVGKVILVIPFMGNIMNNLSNPIVLFIIFVIGFILITIIPEKKKDKSSC